MKFFMLAAASLLVPIVAKAQIAATSATCDENDLSDQYDTTRLNPEWAPINPDGDPNNVPNILEGWVAPVPDDQDQNSQSSTEVSEEETPWNHYTHDYTFKVVPDPNYSYLLSSWKRFPGDSSGSDITIDVTPDLNGVETCNGYGGTLIALGKCRLVSVETCQYPPNQPYADACNHFKMEVEWENATAMHVNSDSANNTRAWGSVPEYVWPSHGDRVWTEGRWIFDCGHAGVSNGIFSADSLGLLPNGTHAADYVKFESEIHPPRALVTFRLNHTALSQEQTNSSGDPYRAQSDDPSSWLPVTGVALPQQQNSNPAWTPPTLVPVTEADIFISGNGGGANDLCSMVIHSDSSGDCSPYSHTGQVIPINKYNYVFDIYPPGAHYESLLGIGPPLEKSGAISVTPPTPDSSLQWRIIDQSGHIPDHTCGPDKNSCLQPDPIILCLVGPSTGPPPSNPADQTALGTTCPVLQPGERPTRLRVILPFYTDSLPLDKGGKNQTDTYFAQSILLGWDDVPDGQQRKAIRRFGVTLEEFKVNQNGRCSFCGDGDWRVFIDVGGQWRWISWLFDSTNGIYAFDGGDNLGSGDPLTENGDDNFYHFTKTPWIVDVIDGQPIHVAVGGFDSALADGSYCDAFSGSGCNYGDWSAFKLVLSDILTLHRIGTYEFDLNPGDCANECQHEIPETKDEAQYTTNFKTFELSPPTPPTSTFTIGDPHYNNFITSATPFNFVTSDPSAQDVQYRFHKQGADLPVYATSAFPIYWTTSGNFSNGMLSLNLNGASAAGDGAYDFQYATQSVWNLLETRHTQTVALDNTPPVATITQPTATQYTHADILTLSYTVSDGSGSGVKSSTAKIDGSTTLPPPDNTPITGNGQQIPLLLLSLGSHTFSADSVDNLNNSGTNSVTFTITVTAASMQTAVNEFLSLGCIDNSGIANSLVAKMAAAQNAISHGQFQAAVNIITAFITELQAQAGKHIATTCSAGGHTYHPVQILLSDAQYLVSTLPAQPTADPVMGYVINSALAGIPGIAVNLLNSTKVVVGTAVTDVTGFYYFAATSTLTTGKSYSARVTIPNSYRSSSPSSQSFTWSASTVTLSNFALK